MRTRNFYIGLMVLTIQISTLACANGESETRNDLAQPVSPTASPQVVLQAKSSETIEFQTQNGLTRHGVDPEYFNIPRLTLFHNNSLTEAAQRTLLVELYGIQVPPSGATASLLVETQNGEPVSSDKAGWKRILVWQENRQIPPGDGGNQPEGTIRFSLEFTESTLRDGSNIRTPSDYYRYEIIVTEGADPTGATLYTFEQDYAFLMENRWTASLPDVLEESPGAAPDELVIYYCDMIPFQKDIHDNSTWMKRETIQDYIGFALLPQMVEAFRIQSEDWDFPWYDAWTSYQTSEDAERLSVALTDGKTWFHGRAMPRGSASISINVAGGENYSYGSLTDGVLSAFHHELFHNHQKNIYQSYGGDGWIGGKDGQWQFFAEGTAVLASAVGQSEIQFAANARERAYFANANLFLGSETISGDLGKGFNEISPYHAALYWRFLYEQCGGMNAGIEDPAAGMQIIRQVLNSLYWIAEEEAGPNAELDDWLPVIMDQTLIGSACPFQTYAQSLANFAKAVDTLRFTGGRCQSPGLPEGCAFYDPHSLYNNPPENTIALMAVEP